MSFFCTFEVIFGILRLLEVVCTYFRAKKPPVGTVAVERVFRLFKFSARDFPKPGLNFPLKSTFRTTSWSGLQEAKT